MRSQLNRAAPLKCSLIAQVSFENNQYLRPICGSNSMMEYHGDLAVCVDCSQTRHINIRCALKRGSHLNQMTNETNVLKRQKGTEKRENCRSVTGVNWYPSVLSQTPAISNLVGQFTTRRYNEPFTVRNEIATYN